MNNTENEKSSGGSGTLPCKTADDFYAPQARRMIKRALESWLAAQRLTIVEFMHSAAALQKFENAGTSYQHAIQRVAVTLAGRTKIPVVQIIRSLTTLTTTAMNRVYADERSGVFPQLDAAAIFAHVETLQADPAGLYALNGILAKFLSATEDWDTKLRLLLTVYGEAQRRWPDDHILLRASEALIAEIVSDRTAFSELLGLKSDFAAHLFGAVRLLNGRPFEVDGAADSLERLGRHIAKGALRDARLAVGDYIRAECAGSKRLRPLSLEEELNAYRELVEELQAVPQTYLHREDVVEALAARAARFVTPEALAQLTAEGASPDAKLERVLEFEPAIMGTANKRAISLFALSLVTGRSFEAEIPREYRGVPRLRRLTDLQTRILQSGFIEAQRDEMAAALDMAAARLETEGRYFTGIEARISDPAERVELYLRLFAGGAFTQGMLARKARREILAALAQPGCAAGYAEHKGLARQEALTRLVAELDAIGITPEESLRAMSG